MPCYLAIADRAGPAAGDMPPAVAGPPAGMVAFRIADLRAGGGKTAAAAGTTMTFCHLVVTGACGDQGRPGAGRWVAARFRAAGRELERHLAGNVIEDLADTAIAAGRMPAPRRRIMSCPLTIRLMVAMPLMPGAG